MHSALFVPLLLALGLTNLNTPLSFSPSIQEVRAEEYAVYDAVLSNFYRGYEGTSQRIDLLVINSLTQSHAIEGFDFEGGKQEAPALLDETIADLKTKSKRAYQLRDDFGIAIKRVLLSEEDTARLMPDRDLFWERFHKKYPNSSGLVSLSRVGFNRGADQALVRFWAMCGTLCGQSYFVLLTKDKQGWAVRERFGLVVS